MFHDCQGHTSTTRVLSFVVCMIVVTTWAITCLRTGQVEDIGTNNMLVIGTCIAGKTIQRKLEK